MIYMFFWATLYFRVILTNFSVPPCNFMLCLTFLSPPPFVSVSWLTFIWATLYFHALNFYGSLCILAFVFRWCRTTCAQWSMPACLQHRWTSCSCSRPGATAPPLQHLWRKDSRLNRFLSPLPADARKLLDCDWLNGGWYLPRGETEKKTRADQASGLFFSGEFQKAGCWEKSQDLSYRGKYLGKNVGIFPLVRIIDSSSISIVFNNKLWKCLGYSNLKWPALRSR